MARTRVKWRGNAVDAELGPDPLEDGAEVVTLTVRLAPEPTPPAHIGREVDVVLTRPMLEVLAQLAADVGAVYHVQVEDPAARWDEEIAADRALDSGTQAVSR